MYTVLPNCYLTVLCSSRLVLPEQMRRNGVMVATINPTNCPPVLARDFTAGRPQPVWEPTYATSFALLAAMPGFISPACY